MPTPRWIYSLKAGVRHLAGRKRAEQDLDDEVAFHLAMETRNNAERGMSDEEAHRRARLTLGGVEQTKEVARDVRPLQHLQTIVQDAGYALRLIRRAPGFALVTIVTVALGVGVNTAIFSVVNGVLLRPLPYSDPDSLVRLYLANPAQDVSDGQLSVPDIEDWRARTRSFSAIAGYAIFPTILTGQGDPAEVPSAFTVGDFFGTLGASALVGRALTEEDVRQKLRHAVLSERFWRSRFASNPNIIGKVMTLRGDSYTVVGVMPASFRYPSPETDIWSPHSVLSDEAVGPRVRSQRVLEVVARLAPFATVAQAQSEVTTLAAELANEFPQTNRGWSAARVVPLRTTLVGDVDTALLVVLAVVGFILLIACANLANLMLARGTARAHEIATRAALGAGRARIVRQFLTESLVLGLLGGGLGLLLSYVGMQTLVALSADTLPRVDDISLDVRVVGFALLLACLTSLVFGIIPALRAAHAGAQQAMRSGRGTAGGGRRFRNALVVAEVALAVVLVIGAGLMARSFLQLRRVDPGFDPKQVVATTIQLNLAGVIGNIAQHMVDRREEMIRRIRALPGVVDAGSIRSIPLEGECGDILEFVKSDGTAARDGGVLRAPNCLISPGYLRTMRIPLIRGEPLPLRRAQGAPLGFLISEAAARRFWPNQDPIGQVVKANYGGQAVVVGIVGDVKHVGLAKDPPPVVYFNQRTIPRSVTTIVARTSGDPKLLAGPIREAIRALDPNQPIRSIVTLDHVLAESIARDRFFTLLFGAFGTLALLLAAVGVYGVLAYSVGQRTREIGVRMALGARVNDVRRMVVGEGMFLVLTGVVLGAISSLMLTRVLQSQLFGVSARDPLTFVAASVVLLLIALVACYLPARRATRIEAVTALRAE